MQTLKGRKLCPGPGTTFSKLNLSPGWLGRGDSDFHFGASGSTAVWHSVLASSYVCESKYFSVGLLGFDLLPPFYFFFFFFVEMYRRSLVCFESVSSMALLPSLHSLLNPALLLLLSSHPLPDSLLFFLAQSFCPLPDCISYALPAASVATLLSLVLE